VGIKVTLVIVTGIVTFASGFGTGWFLSQKAAKKSFQDAAMQTSMESSSKAAAAPPAKPAQTVQPTPTTLQDSPANQSQPNVPPPQTDPQLSFYKNLPSGQKSTALGSGINPKDEPAKVPLQAAIPSNISNPAPPGADAAKVPAEKPLAARQGDATFFTVQMASFPLKSEAEALKAKLAAKGYHVFIVESNQGDKGIWYRVRVGKKLEQAAAKELAGKLGKSAMVIPE
jgi:cell division protein FtsN